MDQLKKISGYFLGFIGVVGLVSGLTTPFDELPAGQKVQKLVTDFVYGGCFAAGGAALVWSSQAKNRQAKLEAIKAQQAQLQGVLYPLIERTKGQFSLVDFAIAANIPAEEARAYLEHQATVFGANFDVSEQGVVIYQFPVS